MLSVSLFVICTCAYVRTFWPSLIEPYKDGFLGFLRRAAVIGDRLSPYVSFACILIGIETLIFR